MNRRLAEHSVYTTIEAEFIASAASIQLINAEVLAPVDSVICNDDFYRLDLSLNPRLAQSRFGFPDRWATPRYKPAGELFLLPPRQALHVKSGTGQQRFLLCHLPTKAVETWLEEKIEWTDLSLEESLNITNPTIRNLMMQLGYEARYPGFASEIMIEALAMQIMVSLQRHFLKVIEPVAIGGLAAWRMKLIDERLNDLNKAPSLAELAQQCNLSIRQLSRSFRVSHGITIGEYITQRQIDNAKLLLANNKSVKSVAYSMGFTSGSSFSYAFRKSTGMTPSQYRQHIFSTSSMVTDNI